MRSKYYCASQKHALIKKDQLDTDLGQKYVKWAKEEKLKILISFHYFNYRNPKIVDKVAFDVYEDVIVDSGAFTFIVQNKKKKNHSEIDWDKYVEDYAAFLKRYNFTKFFELDIDPIVGHDEVVRLRDKLEDIMGMQCIPVWHISRGEEEMHKLCKEYDYISLGGLLTDFGKDKYDKPKQIKIQVMNECIAIANQYNTKLHGLGVSQDLKKFDFYSGDSSSLIWAVKFSGRVPHLEEYPFTWSKIWYISVYHGYNEWRRELEAEKDINKED